MTAGSSVSGWSCSSRTNDVFPDEAPVLEVLVDVVGPADDVEVPGDVDAEVDVDCDGPAVAK